MKIVITKDMPMSAQQQARLEALGEVTRYDTESQNDQEWYERVKDADLIFTNRVGFDGDTVYDLENVFITVPFVAVDFLDLAKLRERNVVVANAPGCNKEAVSEWVVGMLLMCLRNLHLLTDLDKVTPDLALQTGGSIGGQNITILGNGHIGKHLQGIFTAMNANITVFKRGDDLLASVADANIVVTCLPVNDDTTGMLDQAFFAALRPGTFFASISRHDVYDVDELLAAVDDGRVAGVLDDVANAAVADPTDQTYRKLAAHPRVFATPHVASMSAGSIATSYDIIISNAEAWARGEEQNVVN